MIKESYPELSWTHRYTDSSAATDVTQASVSPILTITVRQGIFPLINSATTEMRLKLYSKLNIWLTTPTLTTTK